MTTDTFVVRPLFFPGGDIGKLAVYGTVNDLAMSGARPLYLSAGFILEEGLPMETLRRVVDSMARGQPRGGRADHHRRHQGRGSRQGRRHLHQHGRRGACAAGHRHRAAARRARRRGDGQRRPGPAWHGRDVGPRGARFRERTAERLRARWPGWSRRCRSSARTCIASAI